MVNILCVHWGNKYNGTYVNRLYRMVSKNLTLPFNFYCYSNNNFEYNKNIKIIPITSNDLEIYWNKLAMFQKDFVPPGPCLFFDLDVVIQKNIDHIFNYLSSNLTMIKAHWKGDVITYGESKKHKERWDMYVNSSMLLWESNKCTNIWEHFQKDPDYFIVKYKGIDRFIFHENFKINHFPKYTVYSRLAGAEKYPEIIRESLGKWKEVHLDDPGFYGYQPRLFVYHIEDIPVCIFNGPHYEIFYEGMEHYWS